LGQLHFVHPLYLLLLLLIPALIWWLRRQQQQRYVVMEMSSLQSTIKLSSWRSRLRPLLPYLRLVALALLIIAMARPQRTLKEEKINAEGIDIVMTMDLSSSMLAQDFKPDRLEVAKRMAKEFVSQRQYDRIGMVVFAGEAFTQCPLTTDHEVLQNFISQLQCGLLEDGTAIGMGLAAAVNRLKDSPAKTKVVILVTDGVNNVGYFKPITAGEIAKEFGIKVYAIGVGSVGEALTPVSRRSDGRFIFGLAPVEIDEDLLRQISKMTGGKYFRATSANDLQQIYRQIDRLEKTKIEVTAIKRYSEEFRWFALAALVILALEFLLRYSVLRAIM
jgi:Ca-activated chloride channel family protein